MAVIGNLDDLAAVEILQLLALGKKSGILRIVSGNSSGEIALEDGQVLSARCDELIGEEALFSVLSYEEGYFEFETCQPTCEQTIFSGTEGLILEAMRRTDELGIRSEEDVPAAGRAVGDRPVLCFGDYFGDYYRSAEEEPERSHEAA